MSTTFRALQPELIDALRSTQIWQQNCPVAIERLALVEISYVDFDSARHDDGELIVFDAVAPRVQKIFERLLELKFPIAQIKSLHHYDGDDEKSMAANNSSCFNFRPIAGGKTVSMHGYGLAIDINPVQNPFLTFQENDGIANIHPPAGWQFINRRNQKPGMIEPVISVFAENGFVIWGGSWTTPIDYHHVQPPRMVADLLTIMNKEDGIRFFEFCADRHAQLVELLSTFDLTELAALYKSDSDLFFDKISIA
ncbi:MAG: M15 family metallopeptidase [Candidatus Melainabacteria bacterium]|nr:M15 family metallopeptidase [Candidatus Melainabacteria bacterium]